MKKLFALLMAAVMCFSFAACGGNENSDGGKENNANGTTSSSDSNKGNESKAVEYFKECSALPTPDSVADFTKTGSSTTTSNGVVKQIKYSYSSTDGESAYESYITRLKTLSFQIKDKGEEGVLVIENKIGVATIKCDKSSGFKMDVCIIPEAQRVEEKDVVIVGIGDTIKTENFEYTIDNVEFTYEVLPPNTSSVYTSYPAAQGKVYLHMNGKLKNLMKRDIRIDETFSPVAIYGDGYVYDGFVIVDDDNRFDWGSSYSAGAPLETRGVHVLVEVPDEVESSDENVLISLKTTDGGTYQLNYRVKTN